MSVLNTTQFFLNIVTKYIKGKVIHLIPFEVNVLKIKSLWSIRKNH